MRYFSQIMVLCLFLGSCAERDEPSSISFSDAEEQALAFLKKDPFMRVVTIKRLEDERLLVSTRQGDERIYYRIDTANGDTPKSHIEAIPQHVIFKENF